MIDQTDRDDRPLAIPTSSEGRRPSVGQTGLVMLGLAVGILLMSLQLWLLTLAFDLYQLNDDRGTVLVAIFSGLVFLGGVIMLRLLGWPQRPPRRGSR
ncbi:MAG: hypothetical protein V9F06_13890 [Thermomicrobiales bacterium]